MRADQRKFGKSAWAAAVERMERLQYAVSRETLQLMRAKEICLEQRKHGLKEEVKQDTRMLFSRMYHYCRLRCVCVSVSDCVVNLGVILKMIVMLSEVARSHNSTTERHEHVNTELG